MPLIQVNMLEGRSQAAKAAFAESVTQAAVENLGVKTEQVRVLIHEIAPESWFTAGQCKEAPK